MFDLFSGLYFGVPMYIFYNPSNPLETLKEIKKKIEVIFLDPPYDSEFTDYGYCSFGVEEHRKLAECFKRSKAKCMIVIGKTPLIDELYGDYIKHSYPKNYRFKLHSNRIGNEINTTHVVITNY